MSRKDGIDVSRWLNHEKRLATCEESIRWIKRICSLIVGLELASIGLQVGNHLGLW